jgi:hypothetical protein
VWLEKLLNWIAVTDQPFESVESPEFRDLLQYTHFSKNPLPMPSRKVIQRKLMKKGEQTIEDLKDLISVSLLAS